MLFWINSSGKWQLFFRGHISISERMKIMGLPGNRIPSLLNLCGKKFATPHEMQAYFVNKVHRQLLPRYGKKTIGLGLTFFQKFTKGCDCTGMVSTQPPVLAQQIIDQGNSVIVSKGLYLDHFFPAYIHYKLDFPSEQILGGGGSTMD